MSKLLLVLFGFAVLGGCALPQSGGIGLNALETQDYQRDQRWLPRDFVQVQRAVLQHDAACGTHVRFAVDQVHPNYARVMKNMDAGQKAGGGGWSTTMVLGIQLMTAKPAQATLYSYYMPDSSQIQEMYEIVLHPEVCPGVAQPAKRAP
jgi:hypothetical protein